MNQRKLDKAIQWAGSISALARELGVTRQAAQKYVRRDWLPDGRAAALEEKTGGEIRAEEVAK